MGKGSPSQEWARDFQGHQEGRSGAEREDQGVGSPVRREVPGLVSSIVQAWWVFGGQSMLPFNKNCWTKTSGNFSTHGSRNEGK